MNLPRFLVLALLQGGLLLGQEFKARVTAPAHGATVVPTRVEFAGEAAGPSPIVELRFLADGALLQTFRTNKAKVTLDLAAGPHRLEVVARNAAGQVSSSDPVIVTAGRVLPPLVPVDREGLGAGVYANHCAPCHGSPPGGNPRIITESGFPTDINYYALIAASKHAIKPGVVSQHGGTHIAGGASSLSNYVNHVMTPEEHVSLAGFVASRSPLRLEFRGSVTAGGIGVPGALLWIESEYNPGLEVRADEEGNYGAAGLLQGDYWVRLAGGGFPGNSITHEIWRTPYVLYLNSRNIAFEDKQTVDFAWPSAVAGAISMNSGLPVPGLTVRAESGGALKGTAVTDASGHYLILVESGTHQISPAVPSGWALDRSQASVTVADQVINGIDFKVTTLPPPQITGFVTNSLGAPVAGVTVRADELPGISAETGADGAFALPLPGPGTYTVRPSLSNFRFLPSKMRVEAGLFDSSGHRFLGVLIPHVIAGNVRTRSGQPIAGALIEAGGLKTSSAADGSYDILARNGPHTVTIQKPPFVFREPSKTVMVSDADVIGVDFEGALERVYVTTAGRSAHDGDAWTRSKGSIQEAIETAADGGEVWVAAGLYPATGLILKNGISLYGGFAGVEGSIEERTLAVRNTTLDGRNFPVDGVSRNVVVVRAFEQPKLAEINGFTIQGGVATSPSHGGGIHIESGAAIKISRNVIQNNRAQFGGGGVYCGAGATPIIANNVISGNEAQVGGGVYLDFGARPQLLANNLLSHNRSANFGSGLAVNASSATIVNNTIVRNSGTADDQASVNFGFGTAVFANNIVALNQGGLRASNPGGLTLAHNCIRENGRDYIDISQGPSDLNAVPLFVDSEFGVFHPRAESPVIDRGDDSFVPAGALDLDFRPRKNGASVDIGAHEFRPSLPPVVQTIRPASGLTAAVGSEIEFLVEAADPDGAIREIAVVKDGIQIASLTTPPYLFQWMDVTAGLNTFVFRAIDNLGNSTDSIPLEVRIEAAASPQLGFEVVGTNLKLRWVTEAVGFRLEQCADISSAENWRAVPAEPVRNGSEYTLSVDLRETAQFYRLRN